MRLLECFKARRRRTRMIARAKWLVTQMDRKAILEFFDDLGIRLSGLRGYALSVEMNGWEAATRGKNDSFKRQLKRFMRFAEWLHAKGLWESVR